MHIDSRSAIEKLPVEMLYHIFGHSANLSQLALVSRTFRDTVFDYRLTVNKELKCANLSGQPSSQALADILNIAQLGRLTLSGPINKQDIDRLCASECAKTIQALVLESIPEDALPPLFRLPALRSIHLQNMSVLPSCLSQLTHLRSLYIRAVTDTRTSRPLDARSIAQCTGLRMLSLPRLSTASALCLPLASLPHLETVELQNRFLSEPEPNVSLIRQLKQDDNLLLLWSKVRDTTGEHHFFKMLCNWYFMRECNPTIKQDIKALFTKLIGFSQLTSQQKEYLFSRFVQGNDLPLFNQALDANVNINAKAFDMGRTALGYLFAVLCDAASRKDDYDAAEIDACKEMIRTLLRNGADPNIPDDYGVLVLFQAMILENADAFVQELINASGTSTVLYNIPQQGAYDLYDNWLRIKRYGRICVCTTPFPSLVSPLQFAETLYADMGRDDPVLGHIIQLLKNR